MVFGFTPAACGPGADSSSGSSDASTRDSDVVRPEGSEGSSRRDAARVNTAGDAPASPLQPDQRTTVRGRVVFLGTSLTAGYGLDNPSHRFTNRIQVLADSAALPFRMVNAGVSGDTSAGGVGRISWLLRAPVQVLVLELGANDGIRGFSPDSMKANLQAVIDSTRTHYPEARLLLSGMLAPPNMGQAYTSEFSSIFFELAQANGGSLIPFLLEGVAGVPELNQADGIHPTAEGHRMVAQTIWQHLRPILDELHTERVTGP